MVMVLAMDLIFVLVSVMMMLLFTDGTIDTVKVLGDIRAAFEPFLVVRDLMKSYVKVIYLL